VRIITSRAYHALFMHNVALATLKNRLLRLV
jgi:hypothetical protein